MGITAKELARKLNLSEAAISMALNNKPGVSTATRKKILAAAKEFDYDFSRISSQTTATEIKGSIYFILFKKHGAVISDTPFFSELSEGINKACENAGYYMNIQYLYNDSDIEAKVAEFIRLGCKGIILLATEMQNEDIAAFSRIALPIVVLDSYFDEYATDYVLINNMQGAYIATNYLIRSKCSQPGYLHSAYPIQNFNQRADGFYKAIRTNGMSASRSIIHKLTPSIEGAYYDMLSIIKNGDDLAKCYFADNDLIAAGAIRAFKECGYNIPKDISIVGFDNMPIATCIEPALTTVRVPKKYMGEIATHRLIELISGKNIPPVKIEVETTLIKRKSG